VSRSVPTDDSFGFGLGAFDLGGPKLFLILAVLFGAHRFLEKK
jgi:hypothetical protein